MKIRVKVKPGAKVEKIELVEQAELGLEDNLPTYIVSVKELPTEGKANKAVVKALAHYFSVSQSDVQLTLGQTARFKLFEINKN
ncbi:MAG TPA: DUF167 domain-containing protein [Patescibacteria group bacterium]